MTDPITAGSLAAPVVKSALDGLGATLAKQLGKFTKPMIDRAVVDFGIGFRSYLDASYNRCKVFKTILNQSQPLDVKKHYVHNTLCCGDKTVTDDDLIQSISSLKRVVVTGLAGSGKSMFMKYLTLWKFENPTGSVPLFVELRHLNSLTQRDLLEFIRASCTGKGYDVSSDQFRMALSSGAFLIILDGFDELNHEFRDELSEQILAISTKYPETSIIISSRQDSRFGSWPAFHVYHVDKLTKEQSLELINSLQHNEGVKRRFYKEVKTRLYESHTSFLSSPLLTTIMLLTYEEFAEIPVKMHSFYNQAFDTLFQKHDASKEQYQRKTHTNLGREDFKFAFSAFCAMSYLNEQFSFEQSELDETAQSAVKYVKQARTGIARQFTAKALIDDLKESVCLLQQDGIETAFVHRSFQEFFAAVFATSLHGEKIRKVLDKYALRYGDSVIIMAMEISREPVEQEWVLPTIEKLELAFELNDDSVSTTHRLNKALESFALFNIGGRITPAMFKVRDEFIGALETICALYPSHLGRTLLIRNITFNVNDHLTYLTDNINSNLDKFNELQGILTANANSKKPTFVKIDLSQNHDWWLNEIGADESFRKMRSGFAAVKRDIAARAKKRRVILEDFL